MLEFIYYTLSLTELSSVVEQSYTPKPQVVTLRAVADYKSIIESAVREMHHHSKPLCFRFLLNESTGKAELHYRHKTPEKWLPSGPGLQLLEVCDRGR